MGSSITSFVFIVLVLHLFTASASASKEYGDHQEPYDESSEGVTPPTFPSQLPEILPLDNYLSLDYYDRSCPEFEAIVDKNIKKWLTEDYTLAASLIRLHFHDCAVRGCDGSILLNHDGCERKAAASKTLRGFQVIDDIKEELERKCPKTVSCSDILTAASRDATVEAGGPYWSIPYGRKDGLVSIAKETDSIPMGRETVTSMMEYFQSMGLNVLDLVILSGAHTIGRTKCGAMQHRLYNYNGTSNPDPSLNTKYVNYLKRKCRWASEYVNLDAETPTTFDAAYYTNLQNNMGLLSTDQILFSDSRTSPLVAAVLSQLDLFNNMFGVSMAKLGNVGVLTGEDEGEIRTNCNFVNPPTY